MTFQDLLSAFTVDPFEDAPDEPPADTREILHAVVAEIDFALIATAVTASVITARALLKPASPALAACAYLPPDPALSSMETLRVTGLALPALFAAALRDFHAETSSAKTVTRSLSSTQLHAGESLGKGWMRLSAQWRRTAAAGIDTGDEAHRLMMTVDGGCFAHWPELRHLLILVRDGETPCIDGNGDLLFPHWADRRGADRRVLNTSAWHCVGEQRRPVVLADISMTGFGLTGCRDILAGSPVSVLLASGRVLSGVAIWSRDGRAGVRLREPLTRNDVLLG